LSEDFYEKIAPLNELMPIDYEPKGVWFYEETNAPKRINWNE